MNKLFIHQTTSLCSICKTSLPATIRETSDNQILMTRQCPEHGQQEVIVSHDAGWYKNTLSHKPVLRRVTEGKTEKQGCPFDCGPCRSHQQEIQLPIIPITSSCNLDCPICYTHNKNNFPYQMTEDQLLSILKHLRLSAPQRRIVNLTGGEPTQHPHFEKLVDLCHQEGIHRITISTHGLRFLKEEHLLEKLAKLDARIILSFDSFKSEVNKEMLGGRLLESKLKVLELLETYNINTTLLPVLGKNLNSEELGHFIELGLSKSFIRSIEFHTMTFTGSNGSNFNRAVRYTTDEVLKDLERQTRGLLRMDDFTPSPSAHPLCYSVTYLMKMQNGDWLPYPRFMQQELFRRLLSTGLYLEPNLEMESVFGDIINTLWSKEDPSEQEQLVLASLQNLTRKIFDPELSESERMNFAEQQSKAIYIHSHMDDETFDTDRIRQCCVGIREPNGENIPSCAYNVLYRPQDSRFKQNIDRPIAHLGPGRFYKGDEIEL